MGIDIKIVSNAKMQHKIGSGVIGFGWMRTTKHSPFRTYYKIRNPLLMIRKSYIPTAYCIYESLLSLKGLVVSVVFGPDKVKHLRRGISGIFDGIFKIGR